MGYVLRGLFFLLGIRFLIEGEFRKLSRLSQNEEIIYIPLIILDIKHKSNKLETLQSKLALDIALLKKFILSIDFRVDYEVRKKIGNLIVNKIMNQIDINKIDNFLVAEYLLELSKEDIEKKNIEKISNYDKSM